MSAAAKHEPLGQPLLCRRKRIVGGFRLIETTRPEYLQACVAVGVHLEDDRYKHLIGERATVPMTDTHIPIIGDSEVDPSFGTVAMMICTYGDKADVLAVAGYRLRVINLVDTSRHGTRRPEILTAGPGCVWSDDQAGARSGGDS